MEVEISRDGNCSNFPCNSLFQEMPEEPLVALDELAVEARFETCAVSGKLDQYLGSMKHC